MSTHSEKIEGTEDAWETGRLGNSEKHAKVVSADLQASVDASLGLQSISIRLPKQLIDAYKLIAAHHGVGYQPLMRDILQRFVPEGLKEIVQQHEQKAQEAGSRIEDHKKAA